MEWASVFEPELPDYSYDEAMEEMDMLLSDETVRWSPWIPVDKPLRASHRSWLTAEVERVGQHAMNMFRQGDYLGAAQLFSEALWSAEKLGDRSTIAKLLLNRAGCAQRIGREDIALSDAEKAISADPTWLKGYVKAGLTAARMELYDEALHFFRDGFLKAVELRRPLQKDPLDFLVNMAETIPRVPGILVERILQPIRPAKRLRTMLVEQLAADKKWHLLRAVFFGGGAGYRPNSGGIATGCDSSKIELAPFLQFYWTTPDAYVQDTICALLQHGSALGNFSLQPGDTPMHALLTLELRKGDDSLRMMTLVCESLKVRLVDKIKSTDAKGNTLLHVVAMADRDRLTSKSCALRAIRLLLDAGLDPDISNAEDKKAIHYARKGSELFVCLERRRDQAPGAATNFPQPPPSQAEASHQLRPPRMPEPKQQKNKASMTPLDRGRKSMQAGKSMDALKIFARAISDAKLKDVGEMTAEHRQCLQGIVLAMDDIKAVPKTVVVEAPPSVWRDAVVQLSSQKKWRSLGMLLTGGGNYHNSGDGGLATGCDTTGVPLLPVLQFFDKKEGKQSGLKKHNVIRELLKGGAVADGDASDTHPLSHCLKSKDYVTVHMLLEHGAKLSKLSLREGDTPLHAAVQIAKEGNRGILNLLLSNKETDHRVRDSFGNSLLHVAVKGKYSSESASIIKQLLDIGVDPSVKNNEAMMPLDFLKEGDRRGQLLEPLVKTDKEPAAKKGKADADTKCSGKTDVRGTAETIADNWEEQANTEETDEHKKPDQVKRPKTPPTTQKKSTKEDIKERIRRSILNIPLLEWEETEEKLLRRVRQKSYQTTTPITSTRTDKEEDRSEGQIEEAVIDQSLCTVAQKVKPSQTVPVEAEELPETTYDVFDKNLPWEVECTDKVKKILKRKGLHYDVKKRVVEKVNRLAKGEWISNLTKKVRGRPQDEGMQLFEAKLDKASRILWELAIAFSPRLSDDPIRWLKGVQEAEESTTLTSGGRVYSEIIRLWDIVFDHDNLERAIDQAVTSFVRSKASMPIAKKSLVSHKRLEFRSAPATTERLPMLFTEREITAGSREVPEEQQFFPAASSNENEYNILKFYSFSSSLVNNMLRDDSLPVEFPFKVTDLEHAIVHLRAQPPSSILLLGRSGTGKTTCCLFRLWNAYLAYWTRSAAHGFEPWMPKSKAYVQRRDAGANGEESNEEDEEGAVAKKDPEEVTEPDEKACTTKRKPRREESLSRQNHVSEVEKDRTKHRMDDEDESLHAEMAKRDQKESEPMEVTETGEEEELEHLHQIFVTKNAVLCSEVGKNFRELCQGSEAAQKYLEANQDEKLPVKLQEVDPAGFPLFLDSRQWLLMLDASLEEPHFFKRSEEGHISEEVPGWMENDGPATFIPTDSDLEDESSDDESYDVEGGKELDKLKAAIDAAEESSKQQDGRRTVRREVTYEVFSSELWTRVNRGRVDYHPTLVWMEIMSIIKGSVEAVESKDGFLSEEEYFDVGRKRAEFTGDRHKIYEIFKSYQHQKKQRHMFDEMDLVHDLYKRLTNMEDIDWSIHHVYVDETQDFTQAELALLIRCCRDPNEMFFTGDTAQSIMRGVSFRFKDLRSLFHKARESLQQMGKRTAVQVPDMYHLTHNYRSHCGILDLAAGVINLLEKLFPYSFDHLPKDRGIMEGPKPLLLQGCSQKDLVTLLQGNRRATSTIEFGAHQVVLVANNEAKEDMPDVFRGSLVLTIYESKGLEFDDVLLYNIFKDSQANEEWRVVLTCMTEDAGKTSNTSSQVKSEGLLKIDDSDQSNAVAQARPLDFNPDKHKVLNSELKNLYTAITRARVNVWIFDEDTTKHAPMFKYFLAQRFVEEPQRDDQGQLSSKVFVKESTPEEWCQRGDYFYKKERWEIAADFFKKGGNLKRANMALAQHLAHQASQDATTTREKHRIRQRFLESADLFLQSGDHVDDREALVRAARCLTNSRDYNLAAQLFERLGEFSSAAHLYQRENKKAEASRCFVQAGNFKKAVNFLRDVEDFEEAANVSEQYGKLATRCRQEGLDPSVTLTVPIRTPENLLLAAIDHYHRHGEEERMASCLNRLSVESRLIFFKQNKRVKEAAELLKNEGKSHEAAELLYAEGEFEAAAKLADRHQNPQFVADCLLIQSRKQKKEAAVDIQETRNNLVKCMELYNKCDNSSGKAEASMMLGDIIDDASTVRKAIKTFGINIAGAVEAATLLVARMTTLTFEYIRLILTVLEDVFGLIRALFIARHHSVKENEWLKACELFYGVKRSSGSTAAFSAAEEPRILNALDRDTCGRSKSTTNMTIQEARTCMAGDLIRKVELLKEKLTKMLQSITSKSRVCSFYTVGLRCPKGDSCAFLHRPYDKDTLQSLLKATVHLIKLQGVFDFGYEKIKDSKIQMAQQAVAAHKDGGAERSRIYDDLYDILFPTHCHQRLLTENFKSAREAFDTFQGDEVVTSSIKDYAKCLWESASHSEQQSHTDLLLKIYNLFRLAKDTAFIFSSLLASTEQGYKQWAMRKAHPKKIPLHVGMICSDRDPGDLLFCSFMRRLEDFVDCIYQRQDVMSSLESMKAFMGFLAKRAMEPLIPSFTNTCFFLELFVVVCYSMYAKMNQHERLCLPASYIAMVHLCDRLWGKGKGSIYSSIHSLPYKKDDILRKVNECIRFIINIICQSKQFPDFNVIDDAFRPNVSDNAKSGEMERVFILALVLTCGCGGPVSRDSEIPLRKALYQISIKKHFPQRLADAIRKTRSARGIRDVVLLLQDLLKARGLEFLRQCTWKYPDRTATGIFRGLIFEAIRPDMFISGFWRRIDKDFCFQDEDVATSDKGSLDTGPHAHAQNSQAGHNETNPSSEHSPNSQDVGLTQVDITAQGFEEEIMDETTTNDHRSTQDDTETTGEVANTSSAGKEGEHDQDEDDLSGSEEEDIVDGLLAIDDTTHQRILQQQAEERRHDAARKIQHFWRSRWKTKSQKETKGYKDVSVERQVSVERDELLEFKLDDTGCRICGVTFESQPITRDDQEQQEDEEDTDARVESLDEDSEVLTVHGEDVWHRNIITREHHLQDPMHSKNLRDFGHFKHFYTTQVVRVQKELNTFAREARTDNEGAVTSEIQRVNTANESFRKMLEKVKDTCAWDKRDDVYRALGELEEALASFRREKGHIERQALEEGASVAHVEEDGEEFRNLDDDDFIDVGGKQRKAKGKGGRQRKKRKTKK